jgi:glycosyltransferase involved in cell wall biosynthesis
VKLSNDGRDLRPGRPTVASDGPGEERGRVLRFNPLVGRSAAGDHPPMRVLQVGKFYPPYRGGIESHLQALCHEIKRFVQVEVLVANETRRVTESEIDGVKVKRLARHFSVGETPVCWRLAGEIRRSEADVVHLHVPHPPACLAYLMSGHRGRLVITWHSDIIRQKVMARVLAPIHSAVIRRASVLIASSPNYVESSPVLSRNRDRCRVIPFGILADGFRTRDGDTIAKIRQRYGRRILLAVGRMVYYKGFEYLVRAMKEVRGHLLIVGDGPLRTPLEHQAVQCGVIERITFLGRVSQEEMVAYYHAADVFVLPSVARSEAFGVVQLEAMACGKPVVNTALSTGVPYVSLDGLTGFTVPPANEGALAAAISRLLDDPYLRARFGAAASRRAREEFNVELMARRTLEVYREALAAEPPAAISISAAL